MKNSKTKIALIYGGPSEEHEVSLATAKQIKKYLDKSKYSVVDVKITKVGKWPRGLSVHQLRSKAEIAFIAIHGAYGEDGTIQAILESEHIPYTGSGILASALAMDKWRTSLIASSLGIKTPFSILYNSNISTSQFKSKIVLKPNRGGSSVGVKIVSKNNFRNEIKKLSKIERDEVLVQDFIPGREVTISVLGNQNPKALPVIEIKPKNKFYDYKSKYEIGGSEHIVPAKIPVKLKTELQNAAVVMHEVLGCRGMSRSDFIISEKNKIYYLESNTIPGMTSTSLLPQAAANAGIAFPKLLDMIIESAK